MPLSTTDSNTPSRDDLDWWSPEPDDDWEPVERDEFDDVDEPADIAHLA